MEKLNIAEILKDCPSGMELDCVMYEDVYFDYVDVVNLIHCYIQNGTHKTSLIFNQYGKLNDGIKAKYVIFPKGKTTWEGFQIPFKDGDIVFYNDTIAIFKEWGDETLFRTYVTKYLCCDFMIDKNVPLFGKNVCKKVRLATEKEREKLFNAIKDNGYRWNPETKTLEKLIEPKFKVGDVIQDIDAYKVTITEVNVEDECYEYESMIAKGIGGISFSEQDNWELAPTKFDITTLKPFESRVLVRDADDEKWIISFWGFYDIDSIKNYPYECCGNAFTQCIPYEGNEHLLGTTDDCDEYYKTWE